MERLTVRELIGMTIAHGDLSQDPNRETGADRIAALGRADPLGAALWRVLGQGDVGSLREAARLLAGLLSSYNVPHGLMPPLCLKAIEEYLSTRCSTCGGRGFVTDVAGVRSTCGECAGTGKGSHTPEERMRYLKIGRREYAGLHAVFGEAATILSAADRRVSRQIRRQLGRLRVKPPRRTARGRMLDDE